MLPLPDIKYSPGGGRHLHTPARPPPSSPLPDFGNNKKIMRPGETEISGCLNNLFSVVGGGGKKEKVSHLLDRIPSLEIFLRLFCSSACQKNF